ncbi:hypothetical protein [Spongiivirga citrea]|uniref:Uncharacterized protein n=1 Tax=Spongiivirga citrea TaxID=1481457 RepID=A0A6M0CR47_9FLAO|nr:hypothetical protein [Spongiivirga citrea]NER18339.1 hypothetical protein [Spongiivirga citrea]
MKRLLFVFIVPILYLGCSDIDESFGDGTNSTELNYLRLSTVEEAGKKIDEILALKEKYNQIATVEFFSKEKLNDQINFRSLQVIDTAEAVKASVTEFHKELLTSVYELRSALGFTSIQSIADEINSLELIDPKKASSLTNMYQEYLTKSSFGVHTIFEEPMAELISSKGELEIDGKLVDVNEYTTDSPNYEEAFNQFTSRNSNPTYPRSVIRIIGYRYNFFLVSYDAGRARNRSNWWWRYDYFSRFITWARVGNRFYPYPVTRYDLISSISNYTEFRKVGQSTWIRAHVPSGGGGRYSFVGRHRRSSASFRVYEGRISSGNFNFNIRGWSFTFRVPTNGINQIF